jgi:hypothetical protein
VAYTKRTDKAKIVVREIYPRAKCNVLVGKLVAVYCIYDGSTPLAGIGSTRSRAWVKAATAVKNAQ